MSIALVTDSTADLPPSLAGAHGITVIPLEVSLGTASFQDGVNLDTGELFRRVAADGTIPKTSQPPHGVFVHTYQQLLTRHQSIISLHVARAFSGTCDAADLARQSLPEADITVIDSGSFTLGLGLQVIRAARALGDGLVKEEVLRLLDETRRGTKVLGVLDTLDYLQRGGRISRVAYLLGNLLHVKPVIQISEGRGISLSRHRRRAQALQGLSAVLKPLVAHGGVSLGVMHTLAAVEAEELRDRLEEFGGHVEVLVEAGPAVGTHVGPHAIGVAVVPS